MLQAQCIPQFEHPRRILNAGGTAKYPDPRRILNAGGINRILHRWRLPRLKHFVTALEAHLQRIYLFQLWQQVFDEDPPRMAYPDLMGRFIERVDSLRFPIDDDIFRYMLAETDDLLALPIPYHSYGIPWECEYICDLQWWAQPVVAVVLPVMGVMDGGSQTYIDTWLDQRGLSRPNYTFIECESGQETRLQEALACLEPPLNGMAVVIDCLIKGEGNCFIDDPPIMNGREEYLGVYSQYFWTELNIEMLYVDYMEVEARIDLLRDFIYWSQRASTERHAVATLTRLVDEPWHIEEIAGAGKKVVFDG